MAMADFEKSKFKFSELFNNSDGKTSGSGFIGVILGLTAVFAFLAGSVGWFLGKPDVIDFLSKVLQFAGLSTILLGVRKSIGELINIRK